MVIIYIYLVGDVNKCKLVLRLFLYAEFRIVIAVYGVFYKDLYKTKMSQSTFSKRNFYNNFFFQYNPNLWRILQFYLFIHFGYDTFRWWSCIDFIRIEKQYVCLLDATFFHFIKLIFLKTGIIITNFEYVVKVHSTTTRF